jgi:hypothetical protein
MHPEAQDPTQSWKPTNGTSDRDGRDARPWFRTVRHGAHRRRGGLGSWHRPVPVPYLTIVRGLGLGWECDPP